VTGFLLRSPSHRLAVQSLPLRRSQPQFDMLLLSDRDEHLRKRRWRYVNGGLGGSGVGGGGGCTYKCKARGKVDCVQQFLYLATGSPNTYHPCWNPNRQLRHGKQIDPDGETLVTQVDIAYNLDRTQTDQVKRVVFNVPRMSLFPPLRPSCDVMQHRELI
jgi:hypothetical protein